MLMKGLEIFLAERFEIRGGRKKLHQVRPPVILTILLGQR